MKRNQDRDYRNELHKWQKSLQHGGSAEHLNKVHQEALDWAKTAIEATRRSLAATVSEFSRASERWNTGLPPGEVPKALHHQTMWSRTAREAAVFLLLMEAVIGGMLAIDQLNFHPLPAFVLGVFVAVVMAKLCKSLARALTTDADRVPLLAARRIRISLLVVAPIELFLLTIVFLLRGAPEELADLVGRLLPIAMSLLAICTPVLAGVLFAASELWAWSAKLANDHIRESALESDILAFSQKCEKHVLLDRRADDSGSPSVTIQLRVNSVDAGSSVSAELRLLEPATAYGVEIQLGCNSPLVQLPNTVRVPPYARSASFDLTTRSNGVTNELTVVISAQAGTSLAAALLTIRPKSIPRSTFVTACLLCTVISSAHHANAQMRRANIFVDSTASVEQKKLRSVLSDLGQALPGISTDTKVETWSFYRFGADAWTSAPYYSFRIPSKTASSCVQPKMTEAARALRRVWEQRVRQAAEVCASKTAVENEHLRQEVEGILSAARSQLIPGPTRGHCTSLRDLLARVALDTVPTLTIAVSDGVSNCEKSTGQILPAPPPGSTAYLVLVPSKTGSGSEREDFLRRAAAVRAYAPWVQVVAEWPLATAIKNDRVAGRAVPKPPRSSSSAGLPATKKDGM